MAGARAAMPLIAPAGVGPSPVPTHCAAGELLLADGSTTIALQVSSPTGVQIYFLDRDAARALGNALQQFAGGIVVAPAAAAAALGVPL